MAEQVVRDAEIEWFVMCRGVSEFEQRLFFTRTALIRDLTWATRELRERGCRGFCPGCDDAVYEDWPDCPTCGNPLDAVVPLGALLAELHGEKP
jgi:hypothetical protein